MIALFGRAGSGKSLQGQLLAKKHSWTWLSAGKLLRDLNDAELNIILQNGELVDDTIVTRLMHEAMTKAEAQTTEVILDGYPRDQEQAEWMQQHGDLTKIQGAIMLEVSKEELWQRIDERQRNDDTKETIERRWEIFEQNIYSILPLFKSANVKVTTIDGSGSIEEVTSRIEQVLTEWGILNSNKTKENS